MKKEAKWYLFLFVWLTFSCAIPLVYLTVAEQGELDHAYEKLKLAEDQIIHERNELIFLYSKMKVAASRGADRSQAVFEYELASTAARQSSIALGQSRVKVMKAKSWLSFLKFGFVAD